MGQCVSRKAGAVIASGHRDSLTYRIMEKPVKSDNKGAAKRTASQTRGSAMSFGFRRRPTSGIPMPITTYSTELNLLHPRSKSAGPEQTRRSQDTNSTMHSSSSGRSTPRLVPPKKEAGGIAVRTNRFGYRQPQTKFTNKVGDICNSHRVSHYNQEKQQEEFPPKQPNKVVHTYYGETTSASASRIRPMPAQNLSSCSNNLNTSSSSNHSDAGRKISNIPEPVGRYTLHTSHLPLPQCAVRVTDANSKIAKTAANQSKKVSSALKSSNSLRDGSGTEDSGIGSQSGYLGEGIDQVDESLSRRRGLGRSRNLRTMVSGKSFDVRDIRDNDSTVTEISVIPLPKSFATASTALPRERPTQRIINKDNRYTESMASMSTTSSEGCDEGLGEEKVYKDRSHSEKIPSIKSDFSPPSSDDPEYGHGEAMADEYSLSSSDECQRPNFNQHLQTSSSASKTGALSKNALRSVLLTIEDPAFAAAAATSTALIDDETSPVDSLFDSPTASLTQTDVRAAKKEHTVEQPGNTLDDESPGTPTNASNSLSLSEGREYFDDEIADQPGLVFDDNSRTGGDTQSGISSQAVTESQTLVESNSKTGGHGKSATNSPLHGRRITRACSVGTLSPCESIASDDLILDYERSDASSYEEQNRTGSNTALNDAEDATVLLAHGGEVMRQWSSLLGTSQPQQNVNNANTVNNNVVVNGTNNNNQLANEIGLECEKALKLRNNKTGTDSPRRMDTTRNRQIPSPLKSARNVRSPSLDSGDEGSLRLDRDTYQYMSQDIVSIKTMLLRLKQILYESEENCLMRADTLNPFENLIKNGLFCNVNEMTDVSTSPGTECGMAVDELADLRRQVIFLQGQLQDRDRLIQDLQVNVSKLQTPSPIMDYQNEKSPCNAATQTEKTRHLATGALHSQTLPQDGVLGPLVSWSDSWNGPRSPLRTESNGNKSPSKIKERLPRAIRRTQEQSPRHRQDELITQKSPIEGSPRTRRPYSARSKIRSKPLEEKGEIEGYKPIINDSLHEPFVPTPRRLTASTIIPKIAKTVP